MHVENLASILTGDNSGEVQDELNERLQAFAEGEIDHASEAFSSLWRVLTSSGGGGTTRDGRSDSVSFPFLGRRLILIPVSQWWGFPLTTGPTLDKALIKTIRQGTLCDRKYSAKRNGVGDLGTPVYISSIVLGDTEPKLNTRKLPFIREHIPPYPNSWSDQRSEEGRGRVFRR